MMGARNTKVGSTARVHAGRSLMLTGLGEVDTSEADTTGGRGVKTDMSRALEVLEKSED